MDWLLYDNGLRHERVKLACHQNKLYKSLDYWPRDKLTFDFLERGMGIVPAPHFVYGFSIKILLI